MYSCVPESSFYFFFHYLSSVPRLLYDRARRPVSPTRFYIVILLLLLLQRVRPEPYYTRTPTDGMHFLDSEVRVAFFYDALGFLLSAATAKNTRTRNVRWAHGAEKYVHDGFQRASYM